VRPLVFDRLQPRIKRVAERALVVHRGREVACLDRALSNAMLFVRGLSLLLRSERPDVDADALLADPRTP
jgi:hypothetical protein